MNIRGYTLLVVIQDGPYKPLFEHAVSMAIFSFLVHLILRYCKRPAPSTSVPRNLPSTLLYPFIPASNPVYHHIFPRLVEWRRAGGGQNRRTLPSPAPVSKASWYQKAMALTRLQDNVDTILDTNSHDSAILVCRRCGNLGESQVNQGLPGFVECED